MAAGQVFNRNSFLDNLAKNLGRERSHQVEKPAWNHNPQWEVLKGASQDELVEVLKKQCLLIHTDVHETVSSELSSLITHLIKEYGGKSVVTWDDPRFEEFGLTGLSKDLYEENIAVRVWDREGGEENLSFSATADIGITFSDATLAESGTVVLFSDKGKGRAVSLLPVIYLAIIPKSTIVPRMTQVAKEIHNKVENGELVPSCVNFISGPSNSADIEMNLIVGVHGPVRATYIIVDDK
ncbi:lactate utilization protein C [Bacillus sp. ISL-47]|uniref:LutC/YkgG family protein n=1 Tax=Bacillus sp. ISL-47 TaxID=2819130 RepID=UPI001BE9572F|nr:lactate utilization protein C [Bacillus sp. ISL-47]MBT2688509.1 lactate utilization protein C [Bacillus sp. ISL-47]MBT2709028.1 lactate utilization protein C [Pseudomonas sp. ISL-84]